MRNYNVGISFLLWVIMFSTLYSPIFACQGEKLYELYIGNDVVFSEFSPENNTNVLNDTHQISWSYWLKNEIGDGKITTFNIMTKNGTIYDNGLIQIASLPTTFTFNFSALGYEEGEKIVIRFYIEYDRCPDSYCDSCSIYDIETKQIYAYYVLYWYSELPNYFADFPYWYIIIGAGILLGVIVFVVLQRRKTAKTQETYETLGIKEQIYEEEYYET